MLQVVAEPKVGASPGDRRVATDRVMGQVEVVVGAGEDREAELERIVEQRRRRLTDATADRREHERADDLLPLEKATLGGALTDDVVERECLAGTDHRAVDEVGHQMHVVDAVRRRHAHLRGVGDELLADPEGVRLGGRQLRVARTKLHLRQVTAVRGLRHGHRELQRVDVAAGLRRHDVHAVTRDCELGVVRPPHPLAEPRPDRARQQTRIEPDREAMLARPDLQRTRELLLRQRAQPRAVVRDRDRPREEQPRRRRSATCRRVGDRRANVDERRVDRSRIG